MESHLLQMRGLKQKVFFHTFVTDLSHLLQMRGLKPLELIIKTKWWVASFTDAWIETIMEQFDALLSESHLLQMRGLKQDFGRKVVFDSLSHLLQMRGLKPNGYNGSSLG